MRILKFTLDGLPHFNGILDIDFVAQQRVDDDDKKRLYSVFSKIYVNQVLSFVGMNASGKTVILKAISFVMKILNNEPVNSIRAREILSDLGGGREVVMTAYFYGCNSINKLETVIGKTVNPTDGSERFVILDERLWSKEAGRIRTKKGLFDFEDSDLKEKRDRNAQYLMDDVSIIVEVNKKNAEGFYIRDMLRCTDKNLLRAMGKCPKELLAFLDPSIEYLECNYKEKRSDIRLKFYGKDEVNINNTEVLEKYLSSGTVKGLNVFMSALLSFAEGGYLLIDELENHFNREIAAALIRLFMDAKVNRNGATLIFSTHYPELLDEFDRNDGIYIVKNKGGIAAKNLSGVLKRNDVKKSELYGNGCLEDTMPAYEALKEVLSCME